mmetsp:Transcript_4143/g.10753  ORF Transcript_4143/g.10753 Transcript_4143/m.10753 type:complete len:230 (-) Transcript_4143:2480-3169(-)
MAAYFPCDPKGSFTFRNSPGTVALRKFVSSSVNSSGFVSMTGGIVKPGPLLFFAFVISSHEIEPTIMLRSETVFFLRERLPPLLRLALSIRSCCSLRFFSNRFLTSSEETVLFSTRRITRPAMPPRLAMFFFSASKTPWACFACCSSNRLQASMTERRICRCDRYSCRLTWRALICLSFANACLVSGSCSGRATARRESISNAFFISRSSNDRDLTLTWTPLGLGASIK